MGTARITQRAFDHNLAIQLKIKFWTTIRTSRSSFFRGSNCATQQMALPKAQRPEPKAKLGCVVSPPERHERCG